MYPSLEQEAAVIREDPELQRIDVGAVFEAPDGEHSGRSGVLAQVSRYCLVVRFTQLVIRVEPEYIIPGRMLQGFVSRCGEIITPLEEMNFRTEIFGNLDGIVFRSRINDHYLIGQSFDRRQDPWKVLFFISYDHAYGEGRLLTHRYSCQKQSALKPDNCRSGE
jgi:hypothetical protein